ncbi:MAG: class II aldolase/adducin family protein [Candidatus Omnitrophica bacterium]|nr:class II aldolase/adducin family protein [Candidatus Omnitrophota bacterium]
MVDQENKLKDEMIRVGKRLYSQGLTVARSGNVSARIDDENILITASQSFLGSLDPLDIVKVNLNSNKSESDRNPSSELSLHSLVYKNFPSKVVVHCHPPLINGYFAVSSSLKALTFETKFYLGEVPIIKQETPTVTNPDQVIEALKTNNLVVLKNHGVVVIANNFDEALSLVEALEEAVCTVAVARLFDKSVLDDLDKPLKEKLDGDASYLMFSSEHIQAIVDLVNKDEFMSSKGEELDLTLKLAIALEGSDKVYKFNFEKGKIIKLDYDKDAPFIISASDDIWQQVFLGSLDPFVAVTQGKMSLQGQLGQLSRWYVPFSRLFEIFKQVKFK